MAQESRLSIIIDSGDAERRIAALRRQLRELGQDADDTSRRTDDYDRRLRNSRRNTDDLNRSTNALRNTLRGMKAAFLGAFVGVGVTSLLGTADAMQNLNNKIRVATDTASEYATAQSEIERIAMGTYSALESVGELYASNERALGAMGKTQQEVLRFTENITKAMAVSGGTAQAQAAALTQLGQAMASGTLRGDEFNSIAEQAPVLLELLSDKLKMTTGELRAFAAEGGITSQIVYDAISGATSKLDSMMGQTVVTMAQAFENIKTQWSLFADDFINGSSGISSAITSMLTVVATNFDQIVNIIKAAAIVLSVQFVSGVTLAATATGGLASAFRVLTAAMLANPLTVMVAIVLAVSAATGELGNTLKSTGIIASDLFNFIKTGYVGLYDLANAVIYNIAADTADATNQSSGFFATFFGNTASGFLGLLQGISRIVAAAVGVLGGFFAWLGKGAATATKGLANAFIWAFNKAQEAGATAINAIVRLIRQGLSGINKMIDGANSLLEKTPLNIRVKTIDVGTGDVVTAKKIASISNSYTSLSDSVGEYVGVAIGGVDSYFNSVATRMNEVDSQKASLDALSESFTTVGDAAEGAGKKTGKAAKAAKKAKDKTKALSDEQKAAAKLADSFADSLNQLNKSIAMIGKETELDKWLYDLSDASNELSRLNDAAKSVLLTQASLFDTKSLINDVSQNIKDLDNQIALLSTKNDVERGLLEIQQQMNAELEKYNAMKEAGLLDDYAAVEQALALNAAKKEQLLMAQAANSARDNLQGMLSGLEQETPLGKIQADYEARLELIEQYENTHTDMLETAKEARLAVEQSYMDAKRDLMLTQSEELFGDLAGLAKSFAGEQSGIYRALFAVEKGFAIAQSAIAIQQSIAKAMALGFPQNIPVIATAMSQGATLMSNIRGIEPQGFKTGGYTGNMGTSQVAGVVHGQEYVFDAQATKRIGVDNLNAMRSGKAVGGDVQVNIINNSSARVTASDDGKTITIEDVRNEARNEIKRSWTNTGNPNSFESKQLNRNIQAPRRR